MTNPPTGDRHGLPIRHVPGLPRPVPAVGAGCWTIGGPAVNGTVPIGWDDVDRRAALQGLLAAYDLGVRLFDTADVYGMGRSEHLLGQLVTDVPRDEIVLSSKVGYHPGPVHPYHPDQIRRQLDTSLKNLRTDHLDVYFLHSGDFGPDDRYLHPAAETIRDLRRQGLITAIGLRAPHEFAAQWADQNFGTASARARRFRQLFNMVLPDVLTVRHNLLSYEYAGGDTDIFTFARRHGVGVLIKQALGQGLLLGTHDPDRPRTFSNQDHRSTDPMFHPNVVRAVHDGLTTARHALSDELDLLARAALGYALRRPDTAVLVGFRDATQIHATVNAARHPLTPAQLTLVHRALRPARTVLHEGIPRTTPVS